MKAALQLMAISSVYVAVSVLMYRQRRLDGPGPWNSDFLLFYLPLAVMLLATGRILGRALPLEWSKEKRFTVICALAFGVTFLAFCAFGLIAANIYGT